MLLRGGSTMDEDLQLQKVIEGKEKHYSPKKFMHKVQEYGMKLGFKGLHSATTLYCALKSPEMPKKDKLFILGVLGYFILPVDLVADFLPMVGLTDDAIVIAKAISVIYHSISDDMKEEAHQMLKKMFGDQYQYNAEQEIV